MVGWQVIDCEFNCTATGARFESCSNGVHIACRWQNSAGAGVYITRSSDQTIRSPGGEGIRFSGCEFQVCTYGLIVDQHEWMVMDGCYADYCAVPIFLSGSRYTKMTACYFGASNVPVSRFSGVSGYIAPNASGVAMYGRPGGTPSGNLTVGVQAYACEFVCYNAGSSSPIVSIDGYINSTYPMSAEHVGFFGCLFYATQSHSAATLLYINAGQVIHVVANRFLSYNLSTTLVDAWRAPSCISYIGHSNNFSQCTQSGVALSSSYEKMLASVYVQAGDPGTIGAGNIWVQP
jgi:hypothetical protein